MKARSLPFLWSESYLRFSAISETPFVALLAHTLVCHRSNLESELQFLWMMTCNCYVGSPDLVSLEAN